MARAPPQASAGWPNRSAPAARCGSGRLHEMDLDVTAHEDIAWPGGAGGASARVVAVAQSDPIGVLPNPRLGQVLHVDAEDEVEDGSVDPCEAEGARSPFCAMIQPPSVMITSQGTGGSGGSHILIASPNGSSWSAVPSSFVSDVALIRLPRTARPRSRTPRSSYSCRSCLTRSPGSNP
jgi:hypothetical protein